MEAVLGTALSNWEHCGDIESNVSVLSSTADSSVAYLKHVVNLLLTISFWRSILHGLFKLVEFIDNILLERNGLDVHSGLLQWELRQGLLGNSSGHNLIVIEVDAVDALSPEGDNTNGLISMFGLLVFHGLLLKNKFDGLGLHL